MKTLEEVLERLESRKTTSCAGMRGCFAGNCYCFPKERLQVYELDDEDIRDLLKWIEEDENV